MAPESTEVPQSGIPVMHKYAGPAKTVISTRAVPAHPGGASKDTLEPDETYFTYDEHP